MKGGNYKIPVLLPEGCFHSHRAEHCLSFSLCFFFFFFVVFVPGMFIFSQIAIKPSSLSKMKTIFTQEIFTEQVVTAHAVRVAVTNILSANITGFLPIHCIYQLLRSRAFTKHKVSIKVHLMLMI
ncbi:hypothetical protein GOODEAATRI_029510 [Goodea atripinnis]|uniref:Uncharacterized protein n=1 Tax=Goodea atripinnis TaxID=208336 RepID=A0ABV0N591_9TELE